MSTQKKKKSQHIGGEVQRYVRGIFGAHSPSQFSPHFGENFFIGPERKNHLFFLLFHLTKHTPKKFPFPFSLQIFTSTLFHL